MNSTFYAEYKFLRIIRFIPRQGNPSVENLRPPTLKFILILLDFTKECLRRPRHSADTACRPMIRVNYFEFFYWSRATRNSSLEILTAIFDM